MTLDLKALREKAEAIPAEDGEWYVVDSPWLPANVETYIVSRSPDPHAGLQVCDFNDAAIAGIEDRFEDDEWSARNWANAAFIAAACPANVLALIALLEEAREALEPFAQKANNYDEYDDGQLVVWGRVKHIRHTRAILAKIDAAMGAGGEG